MYQICLVVWDRPALLFSSLAESSGALSPAVYYESLIDHTSYWLLLHRSGCRLLSHSSSHRRGINRFHLESWREEQAVLWVHCDWAWCRILLWPKVMFFGGLSICMVCLKFFKFSISIRNWLDVAGQTWRIRVAVTAHNSHSHEHDISGMLKFEIKSTWTGGWTD